MRSWSKRKKKVVEVGCGPEAFHSQLKRDESVTRVDRVCLHFYFFREESVCIDQSTNSHRVKSKVLGVKSANPPVA